MRSRMLVKTAACAAALITASTFAVSTADAVTATIYVGTTNCSDAGTGSSSAPYCTLAKAATVAVAGTTVLVQSGTYVGGATVANAGAAGSPITFKPDTGASVTVQGGTNAFRINGKSYVTVQGFTITGTASYGIAVLASTNITIANNTVTNSGNASATPAVYAFGIYLSGTSASTVSGNHADNNSNTGIYLASGTTGVTVRGNEASGNASLSVTPAQGTRQAAGIGVIGASNSIIGNEVHDNEDSGIQIYPVSNTGGVITRGGDSTLVANNVSYNNGDHGIDNRDVDNGRIIGNTVYHNCTSGINVEGTSLNYVIQNNIAVDNAVLPAYNGIACARRAGNIGVWDTSTATADYNLVYLSVPGTLYVFNGTAYTSLATMKTATGQETHGIQADPTFVNPGSFNLALQAGSPAIDSANSGASGAQSTDFLGNTRKNDPATTDSGAGPRTYDDRGAFEYQPPPPPPVTGGALHPVTPVRLLDTRNGNGAPKARVAAGASVNLQVTGRGPVPSSGVSAVVLNVTVVGPSATGYLTVYPTAGTRPATSNIDFVAAQTVPNLVVVPIGAGGKVTIQNNSGGSADILADVSGWFAIAANSSGPDGRYNAISPYRLLDTRQSSAIGSLQTRSLQVTGTSSGGSSVPASGVSAVVLNVTVVAPTAIGYVTVYPTGVTKPVTSTENFLPKQVIANRAIVPVGTGGKIDIFNSAGSTNVIIDVAGWFTDASSSAGGATFIPLSTPQRLADSRPGGVAPNTPWTSGMTRTVAVAGNVGVPSMGSANPPSAVLANVTITNPSASGYLTVFPGGTRPVASDIDFVPGTTVPNLTVAALANDGSVSIYNSAGRVDVIVDVFGWFA
jgi:parallel beta-helix repeat protein